MPWAPPEFVLYDIPNENIMFFGEYTTVTDEMCRDNIIAMPWAQAKRIRRAKGLPMPCPPVRVIVDRNLTDPDAQGMEPE